MSNDSAMENKLMASKFSTRAHVPFKSLPLDKTHPAYSAWIWGPDDQLGTLNKLTSDAVTYAAKEIRTGLRVGLDWPLHLSGVEAGFRERLKHEIFQIGPNVNVSPVSNTG
jgi:hypothetical protein